jgi:hypothetical protein
VIQQYGSSETGALNGFLLLVFICKLVVAGFIGLRSVPFSCSARSCSKLPSPPHFVTALLLLILNQGHGCQQTRNDFIDSVLKPYFHLVTPDRALSSSQIRLDAQ